MLEETEFLAEHQGDGGTALHNTASVLRSVLSHAQPPLPFSLHSWRRFFILLCMILMLAGLDSESVWSELELRNMPLEKHTRKTLARLLQSEDMSVSGCFSPAPSLLFAAVRR